MCTYDDDAVYRRLIRRFAAQAGAAGGISAAVPLPFGAAIDAIGLDPVEAIQERLVAAFCDLAGLDVRRMSRKLKMRATADVRGRLFSRTAQKLALKRLESVARSKAFRQFGRYTTRIVPVAAVAVAGAMAAHETWQLGMRCLELAQIQRPNRSTRL